MLVVMKCMIIIHCTDYLEMVFLQQFYTYLFEFINSNHNQFNQYQSYLIRRKISSFVDIVITQESILQILEIIKQETSICL